MKLPKTLLGAIMIGLAVQTVASCTKDKQPDPKTEVKKEEEKKKNMDNCPACGMG